MVGVAVAVVVFVVVEGVSYRRRPEKEPPRMKAECVHRNRIAIEEQQ